MSLIKSVEFLEYVQIAPGRNTSKVTADSVVVLEMSTAPAGVVIDGRVFVPMTNVRFIELLPGQPDAMPSKAESMLIKPQGGKKNDKK